MRILVRVVQAALQELHPPLRLRDLRLLELLLRLHLRLLQRNPLLHLLLEDQEDPSTLRGTHQPRAQLRPLLPNPQLRISQQQHQQLQRHHLMQLDLPNTLIDMLPLLTGLLLLPQWITNNKRNQSRLMLLVPIHNIRTLGYLGRTQVLLLPFLFLSHNLNLNRNLFLPYLPPLSLPPLQCPSQLQPRSRRQHHPFPHLPSASELSTNSSRRSQAS